MKPGYIIRYNDDYTDFDIRGILVLFLTITRGISSPNALNLPWAPMGPPSLLLNLYWGIFPWR